MNILSPLEFILYVRWTFEWTQIMSDTQGYFSVIKCFNNKSVAGTDNGRVHPLLAGGPRCIYGTGQRSECLCRGGLTSRIFNKYSWSRFWVGASTLKQSRWKQNGEEMRTGGDKVGRLDSAEYRVNTGQNGGHRLVTRWQCAGLSVCCVERLNHKQAEWWVWVCTRTDQWQTKRDPSHDVEGQWTQSTSDSQQILSLQWVKQS